MTASPLRRTAGLVPMRPRDAREPGRTASPLELFFDLVFVVAVSIAASSLHHSLGEDVSAEGIGSYLAVFFGIWWAWMNFTWFATSFAVDDWLYRVLTIVQMAGVLVLAAGVEPAFTGDFTVLVYGYVIMRLALVVQWLRAAHGAPALRRTTIVYAVSIAALQLCWLLFLLVPSGISHLVVLIILIAGEMSVPIVAEQQGTTPWHPHHITERYGLFTLIVLGESLLASTNAVIEALHGQQVSVGLASIAVLSLVITAALWWIYFWPPHHRAIGGLRHSLLYGYVHYVVFAAAGAFSAGIEVEIDVLTGESELDPMLASFAVAVPVAVFMLGVWWVAIRQSADRVVNVAVPAGAVLVLLDPLVPASVAVTTVVLVAVVVVLVLRSPLSGQHGDHVE